MNTPKRNGQRSEPGAPANVKIPTPEELAAIEMEGARAGAAQGFRKLITGLALSIFGPAVLMVTWVVLAGTVLAIGLEPAGLTPLLVLCSSAVSLAGLARAIGGLADIVSDRRRLRALRRAPAEA